MPFQIVEQSLPGKRRAAIVFFGRATEQDQASKPFQFGIRELLGLRISLPDQRIHINV